MRFINKNSSRQIQKNKLVCQNNQICQYINKMFAIKIEQIKLQNRMLKLTNFCKNLSIENLQKIVNQQKIYKLHKKNYIKILMQSINQQKSRDIKQKPTIIEKQTGKFIQEAQLEQQNEELLSDQQQNHESKQSLQSNHSNSPKCITDPYQYLNYCLSNKKIKIMNEQNAIFPHVYLKDISLHYKGPMQDKAYSKNYQYYINIRRGNTLCQIYSNAGDKENYELLFCRRGMKKFYDLEKEYLATEWQQKLTTQHLKYRRRIFEKIDNVQFQDSKVHLYSIFKQNGQHCQITYVKKLSTWLFASKNVSILVRNQEDLQNYYQKIRFYWAKLIAKQFLNMIKQMDSALVQSLKEELNSKTLLGQHCGYQQHQHITKYDKVQIIFYGIVEKNGEDHCLPVDYCKQFLKKYNFKISKIKEVKHLSDKNSVYQNIHNLLKQTAEGTMDQYGEGSVLYVVQQTSNIQRTIAMCKLKTCEYLIFRRLREMLKLSVQRKSTANTYQKFKFDIQNLVNHYFKPPKSLQVYLKIGRQAFKEASKDSSVTQDYLRYKFVEFMQRIQNHAKKQQQMQIQKGKLNKKVIIVSLPRFSNKIEKYAKLNAIPLQYMYRSSHAVKISQYSGSIHILHMIPRLPQNPAQLENIEIFLYEYDIVSLQAIEKQLIICKQMNKSHLISFIKSEDKRKSLQLLNQKIKSFQQTLKNKNIKVNIISKQIQDKDEKVIEILEALRIEQFKERSNNKIHNQENLEESKQDNLDKNQCEFKNEHNVDGKIFVIYPLLLLGSGKSTLSKQLQTIFQEKNIIFHTIDGDQIRKRHMEKKLKQKGLKLDLQTQQQNQTFFQVKDNVLKQYYQKLKENIENHKKNSALILYIDKFFGPDIMQSEMEFISKYKNVIPVLLIPQSTDLNLKNMSFPFSLQYLLICLKRCIQRQQHATMTRLPQQICNRFIYILRYYSNCSFKKLQMILSKSVQQLSMVRLQTVKQKQLPTHNILKKKLEECIESNGNKDKMVQLIEQMYKNSEDYLKDSYCQDNSSQAAQKLSEILIRIIAKN